MVAQDHKTYRNYVEHDRPYLTLPQLALPRPPILEAEAGDAIMTAAAAVTAVANGAEPPPVSDITPKNPTLN